MSRLPRAILAGLLMLMICAPARAGAATLATDRPCYIATEGMAITGGGWAPRSGWTVTGGGMTLSGLADPAGAFTAQGQAPTIPRHTLKPQTIALTGLQDGTAVASATFKVVNFLVRPRAPSGKPSGSTSCGFSGFMPGKRIYVHVRRASKTYTTSAGKGDPTCGTRRTRLRRLPGVPASAIRPGEYKVFVDNRRRFSVGGLQYRATIRIF